MNLKNLSLPELKAVDNYLKGEQDIISIKYEIDSLEYFNDPAYVELIGKRRKIYDEIGKRVADIVF